MSEERVVARCSQCGAPVSPEQAGCRYCGATFVRTASAPAAPAPPAAHAAPAAPAAGPPATTGPYAAVLARVRAAVEREAGASAWEKDALLATPYALAVALELDRGDLIELVGLLADLGGRAPGSLTPVLDKVDRVLRDSGEEACAAALARGLPGAALRRAALLLTAAAVHAYGGEDEADEHLEALAEVFELSEAEARRAVESGRALLG